MAWYLFHPDTINSADFDPSGLVEFGELVGGQDNAICERVQLGVSSRAFEHGVYPEKDKGTLEVHEPGSGGGPTEPPLPEPLSEILKRLNERFGTDITGPAAEEFIETLETKLNADESLAASFAVNTPENARLTFDHKVRDHVQDMIDTNFKFYKQINDKPEFAEFLNDLLFDRYSDRKAGRSD